MGFKSHPSLILLLISRAQASKAGQPAPPFPLGSPAAALSTPLLVPVSFWGQVAL